jgi:alcohol dehydrogenase class IV
VTSSDTASQWERAKAGIVFGYGEIGKIPQLAREMKAARVMLVTGRSSFESSGASKMVADLEGVAEVIRWSDFSVNVDAGDLQRGVDLVRDFSPDLIVGVGGGTVMDMAKLLCAYEAIPDGDALLGSIRSGVSVDERRPRLVLAPTTSGSGSEATHFAVVYIGQEKFSVAGPAMRPDKVVLDPELTLSASPRQKAVSGIDAVCQAIESTWAVGATDDSRAMAREALALLLSNIVRFVNEPDDVSAHEMSAGSHLAGRAIDVSKTTAAHALSYAITQRHGVSHGSAVALTLGALIETHADADPRALQPKVDKDAHGRAMEDVLSALGAVDGAGGRGRFDELLAGIGLPARLSDVGVGRNDLSAIASSVNLQRLQNNPVAFTGEELEGVLQRSL